jgi:hypothetical protein
MIVLRGRECDSFEQSERWMKKSNHHHEIHRENMRFLWRKHLRSLGDSI